MELSKYSILNVKIHTHINFKQAHLHPFKTSSTVIKEK